MAERDIDRNMPSGDVTGHRFELESEERGSERYRYTINYAVCSCGFREMVHHRRSDAPMVDLRHVDVAKVIARHHRVIAGEKGIYECGCTVEEQATHWRKRPRLCNDHHQPYIPKAKSTYRKPAMTAAEVVANLAYDYQAPQWAFFSELRLGTGYRLTHDDPVDPEQRMDAWAIGLWPSKGFVRRAFEVKVSRGDFLHEIKHPDKRASALLLSNEYYFVTPQGLVKPEEIPEECGLIEIKPTGGRRTVVKAPHREGLVDAPWRFVASLCRRIEREQRADERQLAIGEVA